MTTKRKVAGAMLAMVAGAALTASAQITYVDATSGVSGNTALAAGGTFSPPLNATTGNDQNWEQRTTFGSGGNIFESNGEVGTENAPRLVTTISGLPDGIYDLYAYFWSPGPGDANQQWLLRAGLENSAGDLALYSRATTGITTPVTPDAIATQVTSTAGFTVAPTTFSESGRNLWQASLGQAVVSGGVGTIQVFIDDYANPGTVNNRTWFDGVGYSVSAVPEPSSIALAGLGLAGLLAFQRRKSA
jgi:hypothetical protein